MLIQNQSRNKIHFRWVDRYLILCRGKAAKLRSLVHVRLNVEFLPMWSFPSYWLYYLNEQVKTCNAKGKRFKNQIQDLDEAILKLPLKANSCDLRNPELGLYQVYQH